MRNSSNTFLAMEAIVDPFEYPDTLIKKVKLFVNEVTKKSEALGRVSTYFLKAHRI